MGMRMVTGTTTAMSTEGLARLRLLHLVSPSLPIGGFAYSQGLEWAAESGWVKDADGLADWLDGLLATSLARVDLPVLARLYDACEAKDTERLADWAQVLLASRETAELRAEERNRARALTTLLPSLAVPVAEGWRPGLETCQAAGFALAAAAWQIALRDAALGYAWSWLENLVLAGIKIIPLGQTAGQQVLYRLAARVPDAVDQGLTLEDDAIGASATALAVASCRHETQYTRIFRS
jgi:urease accessory protein